MQLYKHPLGKFTVFENYVISEFDEGVQLNISVAKEFIKLAKYYFGNRPFVYISNRVNNYSINPLIFREIAAIENLKKIAIVSNTSDPKILSVFEDSFAPRDIQRFDKLEQAIDWCKSLKL